MAVNKNLIFPFVSFAICGFAFWQSLRSGGSLTASPASMALAAYALFFAPGAACALFLNRLKCHSIFESLALAFSLSVFISLLPIPALFALGLRIDFAVGFVLVAAMAAFASFFFVEAKRGRAKAAGLFFWVERGGLSWIDWLSIGGVLFMSAVAWRWSENFFDMGNEKVLHLMFARYYYGLPFSLEDMGLAHGYPPPNFINLWEYFIAMWAKASNVDVLPVFAHARCLIPLVGFCAMSWLLRLTFMRAWKVKVVFAITLLLAFAGLMLVPPSGLDWVQGVDRTRGAFNFLGSVHHADSAMEMLLPLSLAIALLFMFRPSILSGSLLCLMLVANFLWHPREYFQIALYFGLFGLTWALVAKRRIQILKRLAAGLLLFALTAAAFFGLSSALIGTRSQSYDEMALKRAAIKQSLDVRNLTGLRNPYRFPLHYALATMDAPEKISSTEETLATIRPLTYRFYWLVLAGLAILLATALGGWRDRFLALFLALLWFFALSWNFSMLSIMALTYSEFFMTTPRLIYLFVWMLVPCAIFLLAERLLSLKSAKVSWGGLLLAVAISASLCAAWKPFQHGLRGLEMGLGVLVLLSIPALVCLLTALKLSWVPARNPGLFRTALAGCVIAFALVCTRIPDSFKALAIAQDGKFGKDPDVFGYSRKLAEFLREVPPKSVFFTDSRTLSPVFAYAPLYIAVFPSASIMAHKADQKEIAEGRNPLLGSSSGVASMDASVDMKIREWLRARSVDYVLLQGENYVRCAPLFFKRPDLYRLSFDNPDRREVVFKTLPAVFD